MDQKPNAGKIRGATTQYVAGKVREMIINGELQQGEPLRQSKLAGLLGTSRVPVREALHLLESEGLVTFLSNRGAVVAHLNEHELKQNQEMRARLETWLLELAIPHMREADFEKAEYYIDIMEDCPEKDWSTNNLEFHCSLYQAAGRELIVQHVRKLYQNSYLRFRSSILSSRNIAKSRREHRELVELCRQKQIQKAVDLLENHILVHGHLVLDYLKTRQAGR